MRHLAILTAVALSTALPAAGQVKVQRWQDLQPYIAQQTTKLNTHTDEIAALKAENATLKSDMGLVIGRYDMLLRYLVIQACATNAKIDTINSVFNWVQPFALGTNECPPADTRYYVPTYLSASGPLIPPPPTDAFDRADGPAGANWSGGTISGNRLRANGTVVWTPTVPADQSAQVTIRMSSATVWGYPGVVVRASATSAVQYRLTISATEKVWALEHVDASGKLTSLAGGPVTYVAGGALRLDVKGTKLTAYYNGRQLGEAQDSRIASGAPGVLGLAGDGQTLEFDDFLTGAAP